MFHCFTLYTALDALVGGVVLEYAPVSSNSFYSQAEIAHYV